ncbi:AT-rich interactive domain-containing protein 5-like [Hibiscus syriacus]|uniref:AT-rich interactive domain-containing protein 5-like n=1 Tax=Hibiscus syriacus TaxID=106335 RepID=UPI00192253EB|nr:AT-rich interactive domain-containing protein 5-like [Hibiscus syriacus]XP_039068713.1 AT-rich interactive domain-containing protein 5-like [Hibiscus syriacus]XP_039068714.1 AT-rich interactive domain-containing protein 5-like [Hibiscus syriacus]
MSEQEKMVGSGSEAQMDDSKPLLEGTEGVVVAEADCLAPMDTEKEAAKVKDHIQVEEDGKLMAQPVCDNLDSVEGQAVSDQTHGREDHDKAHNVVVDAADVQNEEILNSGDDEDGKFKDVEDKSVAETVTRTDEIEHDNELCGIPTAEIKVKPEGDADGVDNQEQTTSRELDDKNPNMCFDNDWSDLEEEQVAFVKEVEAFYKENNLEFKHPKFYKEDLNLLKLWRVVIKLGGYEQVTSCKLWRQVGESFNPPKTCTTVSWTFRIFYEKALLEYEKHKLHGAVLPHSVPSLIEPITVVSPPPDSTQAPGSGRAKRDAATRAMQSWHSQLVLDNGEDKNSSPTPKTDRQPKNSGSLKRKKPSTCVQAAPPKPKKLRSDTMVVDIGAPADWVKINVQKTADCYEVFALVPGFLRDEVHVQSDQAGHLVISGEPRELNNPWGVTPFKKVVSLPSRINPNKTSAVVTLQGQLFVRAPIDQSDV